MPGAGMRHFCNAAQLAPMRIKKRAKIAFFAFADVVELVDTLS